MLNIADLDKVCRLAKIKINETEKDQFLTKLNQVFNWIEQLSKIDVSDIDINNLKDMDDTPERKDIPLMTNTKEELLSNSKYKKFDMYSVPKVIE
ncbi:MAG: Asp-tRNA(Asn)/Glu-tRNA(Gln) amidotransferase subunit GatC [Alphaproteobacteria bacterium]|nr:Asp-tRNA(Asn)/Glu-tRNA(Gln) amidotransferase subunit GatC [Alphaproteobacteria bacterium]